MLLTRRFCCLFFGPLLVWLWSCRSNVPVAEGATGTAGIVKSSPAQLLGSDAFYKDTANYHRQFFKYYDAAVTEGNFEEAKQLLLQYGRVSYEVFDSTFIATASRFINGNFPVAADSSYAMICHFLSWNNYWGGNYSEMVHWAKRALNSCTRPEEERIKALAYGDLGAAYTDMGKIDNAIPYLLAANEILAATKDSVLLAQNNIDIGACYYRLHAVEECKKYIHLSSELYLALKDTSSYLLNQTYFPLYAQELAIDTITMLWYIDEINDGYRQLLNKNSRDSFYQFLLTSKKMMVQKKYSQAKPLLDACKMISHSFDTNDMEQDWRVLNMNYDMATMGHISEEDETETIAEAGKMLQGGNFSDAAVAYGLLSDNAVHKKKFEEAFRFKSLQQKIRDTIQQMSVKSQLFEVEKKYQSEKKEQQIALQQKTILSRNTAIALLATSVAGLVLAGVVLQYRQRQKKLTQEKQNTLHYTRQLLQKTEEERKRIASDLHDSISHELLSLKTAIRAEDTAVINEKVDTIINDIRIISRNLHPVMFDKIGLKNSIEQMAERIQQQNDFMLTADIHYRAGTLPSSGELQVYRIVQEAVTNIIKYAAAIAGKIGIHETATAVVVQVKDNGKGFRVEEVLNSGKAFGLYNIIERSRAIGGDAKIESGTGGTIITITILKP